jgi:hypothetical protein
MKELVEDGKVFLRRLSAFRGIKNKEIGDPDEGSFARFTAENPTFRVHLNVGTKRIPAATAALRLHSGTQHHGVYCMYGVPLPEDGIFRGTTLMQVAKDKRLRELGSTFVTFTDQAEFARRLLKAAKKEGYDLALRQVEYLPNAHCGEWEWYQKTDAYSHQAEWRIITTKPIPGGSLTLTLGSLKDIALSFDLSEADGPPHADER